MARGLKMAKRRSLAARKVSHARVSRQRGHTTARVGQWEDLPVWLKCVVEVRAKARAFVNHNQWLPFWESSR